MTHPYSGTGRTLKYAEERSPCRLPHRGCVSSLTPLDNADRRLRAVVRLVQLARLCVPKRYPVANGRAFRQVSPRNPFPPLRRDQAGAPGTLGRYDRRPSDTGWQAQRHEPQA